MRACVCVCVDDTLFDIKISYPFTFQNDILCTKFIQF